MAGSSQVSLVQRNFKQRRTVLARMSEIGKSRGPLSRIATFCHRKQRVKVYIRSAVSIRGHCEGYIIAFDKHWNLVMDDVDEVWTRKNKYKSLAIGKILFCISSTLYILMIMFELLISKLILTKEYFVYVNLNS